MLALTDPKAVRQVPKPLKTQPEMVYASWGRSLACQHIVYKMGMSGVEADRRAKSCGCRA